VGDRGVITVVGMDGSALSAQAEEALAAATLVAGARRHLAAARVLAPALALPGAAPAPAGGPPRTRTLVLGELAPALDALAAHEGDAVVLASGDPGFFGIVRALRERGLDCTVLPAVSSVALAFARAGLPWDDAVVVSAHGRDPRPAVNVCRARPKAAVLTGPGCGPAEIGAALEGWDRRLLVAEHLGTADERITECSPAEAAARTWADPNVVLVLGPRHGPGKVMNAAFITEDADERHIHGEPRDGDTGGPADAGRLPGAGEAAGVGVAAGAGWLAGAPGAGVAASAGWLAGAPGAPAGWALAEEEFDSRDAVLTKAEVRALALARLGPGPGLLVWDVGAGSGSVGIECARFGAAVIAVERDPVRCGRIRANADRHGVDVRVVPGEAPASLAQLPDPDVAFVGGGGPAAIEAVTARRPARIVVALAAVERAGPAREALAAAGYATGGALVQAARFAPLPGDVHRLAATNPVFLIWGTAAPGTTETASPGNPGGPGTTESAGPAGTGDRGSHDTGPGVRR
jgi:precorrin-6B C5,15-methyltransferase / cobalt-precorrin-6B C5,C15-methyltransferase